MQAWATRTERLRLWTGWRSSAPCALAERSPFRNWPSSVVTRGRRLFAARSDCRINETGSPDTWRCKAYARMCGTGFRVDVSNPEVEPPQQTQRARSIRQAACWRRIARCFRAASNFSVPLRVDLLLSPSEHVRPCDVAGGAVQPDVVVVVHVSAYQTPRIFKR